MRSGIVEALQNVYVCPDLMRPAIGVHASFVKFPPRELSDSVDRLLAVAKSTAEGYRGFVRSPELPVEITVARTCGYWDAMTLRYVDDLTNVLDTPPPPAARGMRSYCGYLLATNSGVRWRAGAEDSSSATLLEQPLVDLHHEVKVDDGKESSGVCVHFKINPLVLYSGGADLLVHVSQFLALVLSSKPNLWATDQMAHLIQDTANDRVAAQQLQRTVTRASELSGEIKYFIYQNLDWNDFSVYLVGPKVVPLCQLVTFIREIPLLGANLLSRLKVRLLTDPSSESGVLTGLLGKPLVKPSAQAEVQRLRNLLVRCERRSTRRIPVDKCWQEIPVFWDHVDVLTLPTGGGAMSSSELYFSETVNALPGQLGSLIRENLDTTSTHLPDAHTRPKYLSGPKDLYRYLGPTLSPVPRVESRPFVGGKWTYAFVAPDPDVVYRSSHHDMILALCLNIGALLDQSFGVTQLENIEMLLKRLRLPRQLVHSTINLVRAHMAYNSDALMLNTLFDYQQLWKNLARRLLDSTLLQERSSFGGGGAGENGWLEKLIEDLVGFVSKVGRAINTRYHGSSKMFEVTDLSPNHQGGVDSYLDAYAGLIQSSLKYTRYIVAEAHFGIVDVSSLPAPSITDLFGYFVEIDWMRISNPESLFLVLHEVGHQLLRDPAFSLLAEALDSDIFWLPFEDLDKEAIAIDSTVGSARFQVTELLRDVFSDLYMCFLVSAACSSDRKGVCVDFDMVQFYDKWFWFEFECYIAYMGGASPNVVCHNLCRWWIVRSVAGSHGLDSLRHASGAKSELGGLLKVIHGSQTQRLEMIDKALAQSQMPLERLSREVGEQNRRRENEAAEAPLELYKAYTGRSELVLPLQDIEEAEKLLRVAGRVSPTVRRMAARSRKLAELFYLYSCRCLYSGERSQERPVQNFVAATYVHLVCTLPASLSAKGTEGELGESAHAIALAVLYFNKIMDLSIFSPSDGGDRAWVRFGENGTVVVPEECDGVLLNPLGTPFAVDGELRSELFRKRLAIFNRLAEARLNTIGNLLAREV